MDAHIYVKKMRHGIWSAEDECCFPDGVEVAIAKHRRDCELISTLFAGSQPSSSGNSARLTEEIMRYHNKYQPHELADVIYERADDAS